MKKLTLAILFTTLLINNCLAESIKFYLICPKKTSPESYFTASISKENLCEVPERLICTDIIKIVAEPGSIIRIYETTPQICPYIHGSSVKKISSIKVLSSFDRNIFILGTSSKS